MVILEALGAFFSILGAFLMSKSTKDYQRPLYLAFISFTISNLALLAFFILEGKVPMIVQMILFFIGASLGIIKKSEDRKRDIALLSFTLFIYLLLLSYGIYRVGVSSIDFELKTLDTVAASLAILGNFLLSSHNHIKRSYAFILFFLADVIFVYVGYENSFYFFMVQSIFFLYTSVHGYINTRKDDFELLKRVYKST